jgi:hypothetical protein
LLFLIKKEKEKIIFYFEGLLAPHSTPNLENHPLLFICSYLYSHLPFIVGGCPCICNLRLHHAVVAKDPPVMDMY